MCTSGQSTTLASLFGGNECPRLMSFAIVQRKENLIYL